MSICCIIFCEKGLGKKGLIIYIFALSWQGGRRGTLASPLTFKMISTWSCPCRFFAGASQREHIRRACRDLGGDIALGIDKHRHRRAICAEQIPNAEALVEQYG